MDVKHDTLTHRFLAELPSGTAVLAYTPTGSGVLEFYRTFVPAPERGRGLGGRLVEVALEYVRAQGLRVIPTCPFVAQWIRQHPENADLLATRSS